MGEVEPMLLTPMLLMGVLRVTSAEPTSLNIKRNFIRIPPAEPVLCFFPKQIYKSAKVFSRG